MAVIGGKENPSPADIKAILEAGGIAIEEDMIKTVCKRMEGKTVHELIAAGSEKFAACGGGGGGGGADAGAAPAAAAGGAGDAGAAKKKEEVVEEEEEEM